MLEFGTFDPVQSGNFRSLLSGLYLTMPFCTFFYSFFYLFRAEISSTASSSLRKDIVVISLKLWAPPTGSELKDVTATGYLTCIFTVPNSLSARYVTPRNCTANNMFIRLPKPVESDAETSTTDSPPVTTNCPLRFPFKGHLRLLMLVQYTVSTPQSSTTYGQSHYRTFHATTSAALLRCPNEGSSHLSTTIKIPPYHTLCNHTLGNAETTSHREDTQ